jgi:hypothetical protein
MSIFRGATHLHSKYSLDGHVSLKTLRDFYEKRDYNFLLMSEHYEDLSREQFCKFGEQCVDLSNDNFIIIPGIEFHNDCITVNGLRHYPLPNRPIAEMLAEDQNTFNVLVHPSNLRKFLPSPILSKLHAVEVWNVRYDGSRFPSFRNLAIWRRLSKKYPLAPILGLDFHQKENMASHYLEVKAERLSTRSLLVALQRGDYDLFSGGKKWDPSQLSLRFFILSALYYYFRLFAVKIYKNSKTVIPNSLSNHIKSYINGK